MDTTCTPTTPHQHIRASKSERLLSWRPGMNRSNNTCSFGKVVEYSGVCQVLPARNVSRIHRTSACASEHGQSCTENVVQDTAFRHILGGAAPQCETSPEASRMSVESRKRGTSGRVRPRSRSDSKMACASTGAAPIPAFPAYNSRHSSQ